MSTYAGGTNYEQTVVTTPTQPSTTDVFDLDIMQDLIREITAPSIKDEPKLQADITSARSYFKGASMLDIDKIDDDLPFGQQIRVNIKKEQNPFSLYTKNTLEYDAVDSCHDQIQLDCTMPCISTHPTFQHITFRLDTEYAYGVRACDKNKKFWNFEFFTQQYALSRRGYEFGREVDLWNTIIQGLIAAPATTVDVKLADVHATHYWSNLGTVTAMARATVAKGYWYMVNNYSDINPDIIIAPEFATELVRTVENPYNLNKTTQIVPTYEQFDIPGFMLEDSVRTILGLPAGVNVLIMKRSPWLTTNAGGYGASDFVSRYPLWSQDTTKQYVAILDPRVGYQVEVDGYHLSIQPYDCDKLVRGLQDSVYTGQGITFAQYGLIMEFDAFDFSEA